MQVPNLHCHSIDTRGIDKTFGFLGLGIPFFDFFVVDFFFMEIRVAKEIALLGLDQCARKLSIFDNFASFLDNFLERSIVISLRNIDMNELKASINSLFTALDCWCVIKVYIHLDTVVLAIVIDQIANIFVAAQRGCFVSADFDHHWCLGFLRCLANRTQCFLIVNIKSAHRETFLPAAAH